MAVLDKTQEGELKPGSLAVTNFLALGKSHQLIEMAVTTHFLVQESSSEKPLAPSERLMCRRVFLKTRPDCVCGRKEAFGVGRN